MKADVGPRPRFAAFEQPNLFAGEMRKAEDWLSQA
jgi:hypothetical protein